MFALRLNPTYSSGWDDVLDFSGMVLDHDDTRFAASIPTAKLCMNLQVVRLFCSPSHCIFPSVVSFLWYHLDLGYDGGFSRFF